MWVLIYAMCTAHDTACVTTHVQFQTKQLCEHAAEMMQNSAREMFDKTLTTCLPLNNRAYDFLK